MKFQSIKLLLYLQRRCSKASLSTTVMLRPEKPKYSKEHFSGGLKRIDFQCLKAAMSCESL